MGEKDFVDRMLGLLFGICFAGLLIAALYLMLPDSRTGMEMIKSIVDTMRFFNLLPVWIQIIVGFLFAIIAIICVGAIKDLTAMIFGWKSEDYSGGFSSF
ncbi:MAG TPA: hypothetical protein ENN13_00955 [Candidatus Altiarchaeales archaeon]|nr:hypothetical protein [Candidatus Altiarchaeales archaeon]